MEHKPSSYSDIVLLDCVKQSMSTQVVFHVNIQPILQQKHATFQVPVLHGQMKSRFSIFRLYSFQASAHSDDPTHYLNVAVPRSLQCKQGSNSLIKTTKFCAWKILWISFFLEKKTRMKVPEMKFLFESIRHFYPEFEKGEKILINLTSQDLRTQNMPVWINFTNEITASSISASVNFSSPDLSLCKLPHSDRGAGEKLVDSRRAATDILDSPMLFRSSFAICSLIQLLQQPQLWRIWSHVHNNTI